MKIITNVNLNDIDLNTLPEQKAVYAIYGFDKINRKFTDYKYVGETENLKKRIISHFLESEPNECLRKFLQSKDEKVILFRLLPRRSREERLSIEQEWINLHKPECNEKK